MKIKLVKFSKKHLKESREWLNDKEISKLFNRAYKPLTLTSQQKWYEKVIKDKSQLIFAIVVDGVYVGNVGLKNIDFLNKKCEYYIFIGDKKYWGKGVGYESTRQLLSYVKKNLKLHKIYLQVDQKNAPARKLYFKIGFKEEGILKDELIRNGKYITMIRMAYFIN